MSEKIPALIDKFGREINYARISITDRCDFRCVYCMSEDMKFEPRNELLSLEEIAQIGTSLSELGVRKLRITGGEPLGRKNVMWLFEHLGGLENIRDLTITTNGSQLPKMARALAESGVTRVNISLDSLQPERFKRITRTGDLDKVLDGIHAAADAGFKRVKLNTVAMKGRNDDELLDIVDFARNTGIDVVFIEEMPLGNTSNHDRQETYCSSDEVRSIIEQKYELIATTENTGGPSRYFRMSDSDSRIGFISPHSHNFCESCNRVRITAKGLMLLCLGQEHSVDLREVLREQGHASDAMIEQLKEVITKGIDLKPLGHDFDLSEQPIIMRHMNVTGG
ncbi:MAG: GTP 3',8-cyclase MoaA [Gammaproteobacteria bacterium]|nr:GTP 3',8-cyclase MoaA [Gammaproteobacteria bacterium]